MKKHIERMSGQEMLDFLDAWHSAEVIEPAGPVRPRLPVGLSRTFRELEKINTHDRYQAAVKLQETKMNLTKSIKISEEVLARALRFRVTLLQRWNLARMSALQLIDWLVTRALDIEEKKDDKE